MIATTTELRAIGSIGSGDSYKGIRKRSFKAGQLGSLQARVPQIMLTGPKRFSLSARDHSGSLPLVGCTPAKKLASEDASKITNHINGARRFSTRILLIYRTITKIIRITTMSMDAHRHAPLFV